MRYFIKTLSDVETKGYLIWEFNLDTNKIRNVYKSYGIKDTDGWFNNSEYFWTKEDIYTVLTNDELFLEMI